MSSKSDPIISGVGQSAIGKFVDRAPLLLTIDAIKDALDNAGLTVADIDGVASWPGRLETALEMGPVGCDEVIDALGLKVTWYNGAFETAAQFGAIAEAVSAIRSGWARHIVVYRTVAQGTARKKPELFPSAKAQGVSGAMAHIIPYYALSAANWVAQYASRHFHEYGTTREQLGQIAINARRNGALNPKAIFREPITLDDYMSARMISSPLCLFDCDTLSDASTVIIVSAAETGPDLKNAPIRIDAISQALPGRYTWDQPVEPACYPTGRRLWELTDYSVKDVDIGQLYDGFSFLTLQWIEALGFCPVGEGGRYLEGGHRISREGEFPINTNGGQIAAGRTHAFGYVREAVRQLRGQAEETQIDRDMKVAVTGAGGGPLSMAMLLVRD
jgi:acetyl-CoA acetyltransferase